MKDLVVAKKELQEYTALVEEIRVLSAVTIDDAGSASGYAASLRKNFKRIGELGRRCREVLDEAVEPVLKADSELSFDDICVLQDFCDTLLDPPSGEELDLFLLFDISDRLLKEPALKADQNRYARQLNMHISVCYSLVNKTARITVSKALSTFYRDEGLKAAEEIKTMVFDHDAFLRLDDDGKSYALRGARFYSALYDTFFYADDTNRIRYRALVDSIGLVSDRFYRDNAKNYNWEMHLCRSLEHMGQLTEQGNRWNFTREQCVAIMSYMEALRGLWESENETIRDVLPEGHFRLIMLRNIYFSGGMPVEKYREGLRALYREYSNDNYDMYSVQFNLLVPTEYLCTLRGVPVSAELEAVLKKIYECTIDYVLGSANMNAFNFLQEYLTGFINAFIELPGIMSFKDFGLYCLAALHPPTYVHSLEVADISRCLAEYLLKDHRSLFDSEFENASDEEILSFVYNGALCHDFGKILMIDTIFIYGRSLLDEEFGMIRLHGMMGSDLLERFESTRAYAPVAGQHHVWYNKNGGYIIDDEKPLSVTAQIVEIADCIDAATDMIGRSYNKGKSLSEVCGELISGSGERYAPFAKELLSDPDVLDDLDYFLTEGREEKYQKTYILLSDMKRRAVEEN